MEHGLQTVMQLPKLLANNSGRTKYVTEQKSLVCIYVMNAFVSRTNVPHMVDLVTVLYLPEESCLGTDSKPRVKERDTYAH